MRERVGEREREEKRGVRRIHSSGGGAEDSRSIDLRLESRHWARFQSCGGTSAAYDPALMGS